MPVHRFPPNGAILAVLGDFEPYSYQLSDHLDLRWRANLAKAELRPGLAPPMALFFVPLVLDVVPDGLQAGSSA